MENINEERMEVYKELVNKWSRIYMNKVSDLFTLEELKQQAWLGVLEATNIDSANDELSYVAQCIKHKLIDMLIEELNFKLVAQTSPVELRISAEAEDAVLSKDIIKQVKCRIKNVPHADFVLKHITTHSVREISNLSKEEGICIKKSQVHNIIKKIREELTSTVEGEED